MGRRALAAIAAWVVAVTISGVAGSSPSGAATAGVGGAGTARVLVLFRRGTPPLLQDAVVGAAGVRPDAVLHRLPQIRQAVVAATEPQRWFLSHSILVERVDSDVVLETQVLPDDSLVPEQSSLPDVKIAQAWDVYPGAGGFSAGGPYDGAPIAIVDSGVDPTHQEFQPFGLKVPVCTFYPPNFLYDPLDCHSHPSDTISHGTHVAGIAAASAGDGLGIAGMSPTSPIYSYKACQDRFCWLGDVQAGFVDAVRDGAKVINFSLGGLAALPQWHEAIRYALDHDVVVVAAAGNSGNEAYSFPASFNGVLSVAALTTGTLDRAWFSQTNDQIDIAAPGTAILSSVAPAAADGATNAYRYYSGTSMATPHVAGIAALVRSAHPDWSAGTVRAALLNTATDAGPPGPDRQTGSGRVDAYGAITYSPADDGDLDDDGLADPWDGAPDDPMRFDLAGFDGTAGGTDASGRFTVSARWVNLFGWFSFGVLTVERGQARLTALMSGRNQASSLHTATIGGSGLIISPTGIRPAPFRLFVDDTAGPNRIRFESPALAPVDDVAPEGHISVSGS